MQVKRAPRAVSGETEVIGNLSIAAVLQHERAAAEATLGRPLVDAVGFAMDVLKDGLGHALNVQQDRIDDCEEVVANEGGVKHG